MVFRFGWQAGLLWLPYMAIPAFILRFIFGMHTVEQAAGEALIFAVFSSIANMLSYYSCARSGYTDGRVIVRTFGAGAVFFALTMVVNAINPVLFTSLFFVLVYTFFAMVMSWLGCEDYGCEASERFLHENNMA